jgi:protein-S-isoprenylcysteine O-methyltransferase Ste14
LAFNAPTLATAAVVVVGAAIAAPVLFKGFVRRGSGVKYEVNFLIQRAPQYASLFNIALIVIGFFVWNHVIDIPMLSFMAASTDDSDSMMRTISWIGVPILISGMIFMIGGWYSLGEYFSTDAEVLADHKVKNTGLLRYVMHPAYSGIIQCLLGASISSTSWVAVACCLLVVAPLWLRRAKYEEQMLIENLGQPYRDYAEQTKWRRLVPTFIPIGV